MNLGHLNHIGVATPLKPLLFRGGVWGGVYQHNLIVEKPHPALTSDPSAKLRVCKSRCPSPKEAGPFG
jgi:hypothetical protein